MTFIKMDHNCKPIRLRLRCVTTGILLIACGLIHCDEGVSRHCKFTAQPRRDFNHFIISNASGTNLVYIGGVSRIYQLDEYLNLLREESTDDAASSSDVNENKILTIAPPPVDRIVLCRGSDGTCELRFLGNISVADFDIDRYEVTSSLFNVGIVDIGHNGDLYLFVAASINYGLGDYIYPLTQRLLQRKEFRFNHERNSPQINFAVEYSHGFKWHNYLYFISTSYPNTSRGKKTSKIGKLCPQSPSYNDYTLGHYVEVPLTCESLGVVHAAHIGSAGPRLAADLKIKETDGVLFAIFSNETSSFLCVFTMGSIEEKSVDAGYGCSSQHADDNLARPIDYFTEDSYCPKSFSLTREEVLSNQCTNRFRGTTVYKYAEAGIPLAGHVVTDELPATYGSMTSLVQRNETIAFLVSSTGNLTQVNILSRNESTIFDNTVLNMTGEVLTDIHLDADGGFLYVLTSQELLKVDIFNCEQNVSIEECIVTSENPYCGWCSLEARCTTSDDCPYSDEEFRWINNVEANIVIVGISPNEVDVSKTPTEVTMSLLHMPLLYNGEGVLCWFDDVVTEPLYLDRESITCRTPERNFLPSFNNGTDHIIMSLRLTNQVGGRLDEETFTFYDCSAAYSCSKCATSQWPCEWCDASSICISGSTECLSTTTSQTPNNQSNCIAGIIIPVILLIISVSLNIMQFIRHRRNKSGKTAKPSSQAKQLNVAYYPEPEQAFQNPKNKITGVYPDEANNQDQDYEVLDKQTKTCGNPDSQAAYEDLGGAEEHSYQGLGQPARERDIPLYTNA